MATFNIGDILFEMRITPNIIKIYTIDRALLLIIHNHGTHIH